MFHYIPCVYALMEYTKGNEMPSVESQSMIDLNTYKG